MTKNKSAAIFSKGFGLGLKPDPILTVSEWAEQNRYLSSRASAEPGKWRNERTPYLREIMDSLSALSPVQEVRFCKGAQVGGSEAANNWLGYIIANAPGPTIFVLPTQDMAKRTSQQRIQPLIEESPALLERVKPARERDSGNTILMKTFPSGALVLTGSNSAVGLRSMPARYCIMDEVDAFIEDTGEGSPIELARARTRTFAKRKILMVSTPTIAGRSAIEDAFLEGDQRYFFVPCPHCAEFQKFEFERLKWEPEKFHTAEMECIQCDKRIPEYFKTKMLSKGEWRPENPCADPKIRSYHLSSLYSPVGWYSWADAARDFTRAKSNPEKLRAFVNTVLGKTWKEKGEAPEWERLYRRRENYEIGTVPPGVVFLTAGADIQKDRIEVEIVGWGQGKESWSIAYYVLAGDTSSPDNPVWGELAALVEKQFPDQTNSMHPVRLLAVDSGYNTQTVYNFVRRQNQARVIATKGQDSLPTAVGIPKSVDVSIKGKQVKRGMKLWSVGVSMLKSELYSLLNQDPPLKPTDPHPPGFCHFPEYPEEFFRMMTAEQLVVRYSKGFRKYEWEKIRDRNEALDCRVLARAAAAVFGIDRFSPAQWEDLDAFQNGKRAKMSQPEPESEAAETDPPTEEAEPLPVVPNDVRRLEAKRAEESRPPRRRSLFW